VKAQDVGGHSFGEVTALCAAGVIDEASSWPWPAAAAS
jgi:malonyl CoA-acyl carrier protein transacylase